MLWAIVAILVLVGSALLAAGLAGKRIDDHPICRRCRFDLVGLPESAEVCPECGSSLGRPKAVRVGHRQRRRGLIALGAVATLIGMTIFGLFSWQTLSGNPSQLPAWALEAEARWAGGQTNLEAWDELALRVKAGTLGKARTLRMVDIALARQKPPALAWKQTTHGDYIDAVNAAGLLDDERLATYLRQSITPRVRVRRVVRAGDPIPMGLGVSSIRLGRQGVIYLRSTIKSNKLPGTRLTHGIQDTRINVYTGLGGSSSRDSAKFELDTDHFETPPGEHTMRVVVGYGVYQGSPQEGGEPLAEWEQTYELPIRIVPADEKTVTLVEPTAESRRDMLDAISVDSIRIASKPGEYSYTNVRTSGTTEDFAFDVYLEADGERWNAGQLCGRAGSRIIVFGLGAIWPDSVHPKKLDVVLEPSEDVAEHSVDVIRIWNGTIRIRDVPVVQPENDSADPG